MGLIDDLLGLKETKKTKSSGGWGKGWQKKMRKSGASASKIKMFKRIHERDLRLIRQGK